MKKLPVRLCVGCQEPHNKREMIRIVKSPEGEFSVRFHKVKNSGTCGAYICKNIVMSKYSSETASFRKVF